MLRYVAGRVGLIIITLILVITINFFMLRLDGGSPFDDPKISRAQKTLMMEKYGLNDPMTVQFIRYVKNLLKGDFGVSLRFQNQDVLNMIMDKLPHTTKIGLPALVIGLLFGIILGSLAAIYRGTWVDHMTTVFAIIFVTVPSFVLAALMQYYFSAKLGWFPYLYNISAQATLFQKLSSMVLPVLAISLSIIASVMRLMRSELVEVLNSDYILLARAKGLNKPRVIKRHAIRNALIPVMTIVGPMTLSVIYGSLIVERFFGVPGLSNLMVQALSTHDYFLTLGINTIYTFMYTVVVLATDLLYGVIDPRIRISGGDR